MKKNEITPKTKELIKNLTQTISKESKKVNGKNTKLIEILQKKLDKIKPWLSTTFRYKSLKIYFQAFHHL